MALERLRGRMPLWAFVLLAIMCLALLGFACACLNDEFAQAFERVLQSPMAVAEAWPSTPPVLFSLAIVFLAISASTRASPAMLQRFLF